MIGYGNPHRASPVRLKIEAAGHAAQRELAEAAARKAKEAAEREVERKRAASERLEAAIVAHRERLRAAKAKAVPQKPTWKEIVSTVLESHGFTREQFDEQRNSRLRTHVLCRQEVFFRLQDELSLSLPDIGRRVGGFDHTTVLHGIRRHRARMASAAADIGDDPPISD